jgi:phage terminase large subunit-like protein
MKVQDLSFLLTEQTAILDELKRRKETNRIKELYPDEGPLRRTAYPKQMQFFQAGRDHSERGFMAANRVGKTWGAGGYETALHLTGDYPEWWEGHRFTRPVDIWAVGETSETTRDIVQLSLMGPPGQLGYGLLPKSNIIGEPTKRSGVSGAMDTAKIRHVSGGISYLGFKSYDQGRSKFQGTAKDLIWLDEEPPIDVYTECKTRLMTTNGHLLVTFTPLLGLSEVALLFLPEMAPGETG